MKKDKKPYNPAAYPLFGIRLSPHPLQFIVMSHLRVQFVLHLFKEVGVYCTPKVGHFWGVFYEI